MENTNHFHVNLAIALIDKLFPYRAAVSVHYVKILLIGLVFLLLRFDNLPLLFESHSTYW